MAAAPLLTSLGTAVLDEIHFADGTVAKDVLGGSGIYCLAGARYLCRETPEAVAGKLLVGEDFPEEIQNQLQRLGPRLGLERVPSGMTTRGLLVYASDMSGAKQFSYTTPVMQATPSDFVGTPLLHSEAFHFLTRPRDLLPQIERLLIERAKLEKPGYEDKKPLLVWEPAPLFCTPDHLDDIRLAVKGIDVFSPNHIELLRLFGLSAERFHREMIEEIAGNFVLGGIGATDEGIIVVRCAEHGCMFFKKGQPPHWQEPYFRADNQQEQEKVKDTTGAGNAFLGGFIVGYLREKNLKRALMYGSVAASFMIEQLGLPESTCDHAGSEEWNGDSAMERLDKLQARTHYGYMLPASAHSDM